MLLKLLIGFFLLAVCVTVHAIALAAALRYEEQRVGELGTQFWHGTWLLCRVAAGPSFRLVRPAQ